MQNVEFDPEGILVLLEREKHFHSAQRMSQETLKLRREPIVINHRRT